LRDYVETRRRYDEANEAINAATEEFVQGMPVVRTFDDGTVSSSARATRGTEGGWFTPVCRGLRRFASWV
uniref:hypothetical protein n=1 Tax=Nocardia carnea TaxID=37328 RepID=UPI0024589215